MREYVVTDPNNGNRWTYRQNPDGSWDFTQPNDGPPQIEIVVESNRPLIERVLLAHRKRGHIIELIGE